MSTLELLYNPRNAVCYAHNDVSIIPYRMNINYMLKQQNMQIDF